MSNQGLPAKTVSRSFSYSNEMKMKWLGVKEQTLAKYGAVSEHIVKEMVQGIIKSTGSDIAIAVSGIAGPSGGTIIKPVGTVYIGIGLYNQYFIKKYFFHGSREDIRNESAKKAFDMIRYKIKSQ